MRLFIGIELPDEVQAELAPICRAVQGMRPVEPPNMHLTLKFLGETDPADAEDLDAALSELTLPGFELCLDGLGGFKEGGRSVATVWAGIAPNEDLIRTRNKVEAAAHSAGFPREGRSFTPHITLGRVKGAPAHRIEQLIAEGAERVLPRFSVTQFSLYESRLTSGGAVYEILADYPLYEPLDSVSSAPASTSASGSS